MAILVADLVLGRGVDGQLVAHLKGLPYRAHHSHGLTLEAEQEKGEISGGGQILTISRLKQMKIPDLNEWKQN